MKIGRLEKLNIRNVWPKEDYDFTPWLALPENLSLLAGELGLGELVEITEEVAVGSFRADIVCQDAGERKVVIENQFSVSDHRHLGQIMTYLVGAEAHTVVWIAESLRDEHRAVIDWLNEITPRDYAFFGVELEVWRIADSVPAPKFEVVVRPNEWSRIQKERNRANEMEDYQRRMEYWQAFLDRFPFSDSLSPPSRAPNQGWLKMSLTGTDAVKDCGIYAHRMLNLNQIGVFLSVGRHDAEVFAQWLKNSKQYPSIDPDQWKQNRNGLFQNFSTLQADALEESDWLRQHNWMYERVEALLCDWREGFKGEVETLLRLGRDERPDRE